MKVITNFMSSIFPFLIIFILEGCSSYGFGFKNHPLDCAMGVRWPDCRPGTLGYENGGGSDYRKNDQENLQATIDQQYQQLIQWAHDKMREVKSKKLRISDFFKQFLTKTEEMDNTYFRIEHLEYLDNMIKESERFEDKKITREEFLDASRDQKIAMEKNIRDRIDHLQRERRNELDRQALIRSQINAAYLIGISMKPLYGTGTINCQKVAYGMNCTQY